VGAAGGAAGAAAANAVAGVSARATPSKRVVKRNIAWAG